jgi:hypothetical protein
MVNGVAAGDGCHLALATALGTETEDHKEGAQAFVERRPPSSRAAHDSHYSFHPAHHDRDRCAWVKIPF